MNQMNLDYFCKDRDVVKWNHKTEIISISNSAICKLQKLKLFTLWFGLHMES